MTSAAKKAATTKKTAAVKKVEAPAPPAEAAPETPAADLEVLPPDHVGNARALLRLAFDAKDTDDAVSLSAGAQAHATLALVEERRTANLIAVLALGPAAWADLYGAGVSEDDDIAQLVAARLGLA
jgi:hypothetical protein